jgi:hypothetical protein
MAGFEVIIYGRFWVITEGQECVAPGQIGLSGQWRTGFIDELDVM